MSADGANQAVAREALQEIQRYLADQLAPMMVVDAANVLLRMPPKVGAAAIRQWVESQLSAPDRAVTVGGYLYHSVKKFHVLSECQLVEPAAMERYLSELSRIVVQMCPEREQAELRAKLSRIGEVRTTLSETVRLLNRETGTEEQEQRLKQIIEEQQRRERETGGAAAAGERRIVMPSPRLAMMMGRLEGLSEAVAAESEEVKTQVLAPLLTKAALEAGDAAQFQSTLDQLRGQGVEPGFDWMFKTLGRSVPGWSIDLDQVPDGVAAPLGRPLQAMHKIVALAGSSEEGSERLSELVYAAIEQLNDGHLAQAVSMLDLAQRLIDEQKVDRELAETVRLRAQESVSLSAMRKFASAHAKHGLLRKVLRFFPAFRPDELLARLDGEPKREQRKLILSLIEVHGQPARPKLLKRLASYRSGELPDPEGFYSRNVVFLLRRIPLPASGDQGEELELLSEFSRPGRPFMVTKEAVGAIAQLTLPRAERLLLDRLAGFEFEALSESTPYLPDELQEMLDRTCAALVRFGSPAAVRAVVDHAFRREPPLGDVTGRLVHLSSSDLSDHRQQLERLLGALGEALPAKFLGVTVGRRVHHVGQLVRALSGSRTAAVRNRFREIAERYAGQPFAEQAREALARWGAGPQAETEDGSPAELSGDLELFGLPTLLQSLADTKATGRLVICGSNGRERAAVFFADGGIVHCGVGRLRGLDAVCQLFERPQPGSFRFVKPSADDPPLHGKEALEVMPTILEAVRRHDEFQEDRALVPDGASLASAPGAVPTPPEEETDDVFVETVWREATRGTAPESCEGAAGADAYRVRRLYAHWFEIGALKLRPAV